MTSKPQQQSGWILPATIPTEETLNFCVTIPNTDEYRDAFLGAIFSLKKWWNWEKSYTPGDKRAKDAAQLFRDVMTYIQVAECGGETEMPSIFRENPVDLCEVQYSNDNGLSWVTMFRKDNCIGSPQIAGGAETNIAITNITNNNTTYAGDIVNIAPKWDYDAGYTDAAMCYMTKRFVDMICDFHVSQITDNSSLISISHFAETATQLLVSFGIGLAASTGNVPVAAAGAFGYALAGIGFDIINASLSNDRELYQDVDAREAIACWMFNELKGETPQFAKWSTSMDGFGDKEEAELAIAAIVEIAVLSEDTYVNFLLALQDVNDITASLPVCGCPDRWEHTWNFVTHDLDAWEWGSPGLEGLYVPGVGIKTVVNTIGDWTYNSFTNLFLDGPVPRIDKITMHVDTVPGHFDSNSLACEISQNSGEGETWSQAYILPGERDWLHSFTLTTGNRVKLYQNVFASKTSIDYGDCTLMWVKLEGEGNDPYAGRDTS